MSDTPAPAIGMSYSVQIDDKRSLVFQTHVPQDIKLSALHFVVDALAMVGDRQVAKNTLVEARKQLDYHVTNLERFKTNLVEIEQKYEAKWNTSGKKGEMRLSPTEETNRSNVMASVKRFQEEITKITGEIAAAEAIVNIGAASGTDRATVDNAGLSNG